MASVRDFFKRVFNSVVSFTKGASASAAHTTKGVLDSVVDVTKAVLGSAVDITKETVTAYLQFLRILARWSVVVAVALLPLPIAGSLLHWSWMNGLYLLVLGLICLTWLTAACPLVMLAQLGYEHIKPYRKMAQLRAGIAFWGLLMVAYFWVVPVWNYPAAIPLFFIICVFLAVAFVRFGFSLNPKLFFRLMVGLLLLITVFCYMPTSRSAAGTFVEWLDGRIAGFLTSPSNPAPKEPQRIPYDLASIDTIAFFNSTTREPRVWYCESEDVGIELFSGPGYNQRHGQPLKPIAPDVVSRIMKELKAGAQQRMTLEQEMRARPHPPTRMSCDYSSIGTIVFFDPTTSEPRIWYYMLEDGVVELFDGPGFHPQYKGELKPITPDAVIQLKKQLKADVGTIGQSKTARGAKAPVIKAEDTEGQVEKRKDRTIRWQERAIEPEESNGVILEPKNR